MGRKPIPPNQRAQPISFSLKPHLIEKIDDYCHDHRFNRSKFLMEAVTQYMLKNDMGYHSDTNVMEMSVGRRVAVGLTALQEANREGELIPKAIMDALRRELGVYESQPEMNDGRVKRIYRLKAGLHMVVREGGHSSRLTKEGKEWVRTDNENGQRFASPTLQAAKEAAYEQLGRIEVE